jgi:hypothetical protein
MTLFLADNDRLNPRLEVGSAALFARRPVFARPLGEVTADRTATTVTPRLVAEDPAVNLANTTASPMNPSVRLRVRR